MHSAADPATHNSQCVQLRRSCPLQLLSTGCTFISYWIYIRAAATTLNHTVCGLEKNPYKMIYLNYAGLSGERPESKEEARTVHEQFEAMLFSELGVRWYTNQLNGSRRIIQDFLGVHNGDAAPNVMFVSNATTAFQTILLDVELSRGDVVLASNQEHPGIIRSLLHLRKRGVELRMIEGESEDDFCHNLEDAISQCNARLLIVSHVAYTDGRVFPIGRICALAKQKNVIVAIDGAQAAGHIPLDLHASGTDFYFFSGHKWCRGPMGIGILFITEQYLSRNSYVKLDLLELGSIHKYFELGTQHVGRVAGLARACELRTKELPTATIYLHNLQVKLLPLVKSLKGVHVRRWDGVHAPGICTLQLEGDRVSPSVLTDYLIQHDGIAIKPFNYPEQPGLIRISYSQSTSESHIQTVVDRLEDALVHFNGS